MHTRLSTTAPGKVIIAGEYAVLSGHPALVAAVNRRVVATAAQTFAEHPAAKAIAKMPVRTGSVFVDAAIDALCRRFGETDVAPQTVATASFDSSALTAGDGQKLGLGSSAAVTVAALALGLFARGEEMTADALLAFCIEVHADAQAPLGARGSGADVAAAVHGGILRYTAPGAGRAASVAPARWPAGLIPIWVWTGQAASTAKLVAAVAAHATADPRGHTRLIDDIATAADALAAATDAGAALAAVTAAQRALSRLGEAARAPLETDEIRELIALAGKFGGAAKSTGAGGGDLALALFSDRDAAAAFSAALPSRLAVVDLAVDPQGVRAEVTTPALVPSIAGD